MDLDKYPKKPKKKYSQLWNAYNLAQTQEWTLFQDILIELIDSTIETKKILWKNGRPFNDLKDMLFCCAMRVYMQKSSRRNTGYLAYAKGKEYIKKVPHFNTLSNYYRNPIMTGLLKHLIEQSATALKDIELDFTTDSSGFSTCIFSRWFNVRLGKKSNRRMFRKAHVTSGVKTNVITAVEISDGYCNDSPYFERMVQTTAKSFTIREVSADAGYLARNNFEAVHKIGAIPYIMFRKNSTRRSRGSLIYKAMYDMWKNHNNEFLEHYHKRSNAESIFNMLKRKFGLYLFSKSKEGQTNELLCKCLCHNICVLVQELMEANTILDFKNCEKKKSRGYCAD